MLGIYQFNIKDYGIYVSQSSNIDKDILRQIDILNNNTHHCLVLQHLWNLYKDTIIIEEVLYVTDIEMLSLACYNYRKQLPFTIDSVYISSPVTYNKISRRYKKQKFIHLDIDNNQIVHVYNEKMEKIGLEVADKYLVSGWYKIVYLSSLRKINYVPQVL